MTTLPETQQSPQAQPLQQEPAGLPEDPFAQFATPGGRSISEERVLGRTSTIMPTEPTWPEEIVPGVFRESPKEPESGPYQHTSDLEGFEIESGEGLGQTATVKEHLTGTAYGLQSGILDVGFMTIGGTLGTIFGTPGLGTALGIGAGHEVSRLIRHYAGIARPEDLPEQMRPAAYAGEVLATSAMITKLPFILNAYGAQFPDYFVGRWLNRVLETASSKPKQFLLGETSITMGAAVGEATAEALWPGETGKRITAGVAGSFAQYPTRWLMTKSHDKLLGLQHKFNLGKAGSENEAARRVREAIEAAGENPKLIAKNLREATPIGRPTAAQVSGSEGLATVEKNIIDNISWYNKEVAKRTAESFEELRLAIRALEVSGDPKNLKAAAVVRTEYYESLLVHRLKQAEQEAVRAAQNIPADKADRAVELKHKMVGILDKALTDARLIERQKYQAIQHRETVPNTIAMRLDELLDERLLKPLANKMRVEMKELLGGELEEVLIDSREILKFRSDMLDKARQASAEGRRQLSAVYGELAEAALEDLVDLPGYDDARRFSRALNDVFTRTYAGDVAMETTREGGRRLVPETILTRMTASGADVYDLRLQELEAAVRFSLQHTEPANRAVVARAVDEMLDIQKRIVRQAAAETIDPTTGLINAKALSRLHSSYKKTGLFDRLPDLEEVFTNPIAAQTYFDEVRRQHTQGLKVLRTRAAFSKLASAQFGGFEVPAQGLEAVLTGKHPIRGYKQLAGMAKSHSKEATEGLRATTLDVAWHRAGGNEGTFSFSKFRTALFEPRKAGEQGLIQLMDETGIMSKGQQKNLEKILREAEKIEQAFVMGNMPSEMLKDARSMLENFAVSVVGARAGAKSMLAHQSGATLVAAGLGRQVSQHLWMKLPGARAMDVIAHASLDPKAMANLLERTAPDYLSQLRATQQLYSTLIRAGILELAPSTYEQVERSWAEDDRRAIRGQAQPTDLRWSSEGFEGSEAFY